MDLEGLRNCCTRFRQALEVCDRQWLPCTWVIALALERGADLVTEERPTGSPTKPNIPDVCRDPDFKCQCINVLEVIKREKWVYK